MMWNPFSRSSREAANVPIEASDAVHGSVADHQSAMTEVPALQPVPLHTEIDSSDPPPPITIDQIAEIDRIGSITIVTLVAGELTEHRGGAALADLLDELVERGDRQLVLDIQNVAFMDSRCVGCLVEAMNELVRQGGRDAGIALANPRSSVAHLFRITRLDRVFPICSDVLAAVNVLERRMRA